MRSHMRELLVRIAIIVSVFMAGMHFPAEAAQSHVQGDVEAYTCIEDAQHNEKQQQSSQGDDQAADTAHHHHGPMAVNLDLKARESELALTPSLHYPATSAALPSRNPVPPLQPPLA